MFEKLLIFVILSISFDIGETSKTKYGVCCEVVSPRFCKKVNIDSKTEEIKWICSHHRYTYCDLSKICHSDRIYLRPEKSYMKSDEVMIMEPSLNRDKDSLCFGSNCPKINCQGCLESLTSPNCTEQCTTYPCRRDCEYIFINDFCTEFGGIACEEFQ